jgi:superfamily I DNA and/or RNA helicase
MQDKKSFSLNIGIGKSFSFLEFHTDSIIKATDKKTFYTSFSLLKKIEIDNDTDSDYSDLLLKMSFSNPIFSAPILHLGEIKYRSKQKIEKDPQIQIDGEKLYNQNGIGACEIFFEVIDPLTNASLTTLTKNIKILPIRQCSSDPYLMPLLLAKYCVTGFTSLNQIHLDAIKENGNKPLIGYQNQDKTSIVREVQCVYNALHNYGIAYSNPPVSTELVQNIRMPNDVLRDRLGTCLDLSILMCSALLDIGLHPILIMVDGHAFCGCFLTEDGFFQFIENKPSIVYSAATGNEKKIILFECTTLTSNSSTSFSQSMTIGEEHLRSYRGSFSATDILTCQNASLKPIPIPDEKGTVDFSIKPIALEKDEITKISDYKFKPIEDSDDQDRFSTWEKKLLDLSTGNKLVNFKANKDQSNICELPGLEGNDFFNYLRDNQNQSFKIRLLDSLMKNSNGERSKSDYASILPLANDLRKQGLVLGMSSVTTLKKLIKTDRQARDETGSPTLYLVIGTLTGDDNSKFLEAPFLLLPISIAKDRFGDDYTIKYDFDDIMLNQTFFEYYKVKKGADFSSLYGVNSTDNFLDIVNSLKNMHVGDINVDTKRCFIANFTFSHYVMWLDIKNRKEALRNNPVIASLLENQSLIQNKEITKDKNDDELDQMDKFAAPIQYDSTQLKAILECGAGNSFILDGPPGTGKSQTIVNMIVNAFYNGKSVLFVAEKQAALEVVRQRLSSLGLSRFALQLYDANASKQSMFKQLGESMYKGKLVGTGAFSDTVKEIEEKKAIINNELRKLHHHGENFYSLYEAITKRMATESQKGVYSLSNDFLNDYDGKKDEVIRTAIDNIVTLGRSIPSFDTQPLKVLRISKFDYLDQDRIIKEFDRLETNSEKLNSCYDVFLNKLNRTEKATYKRLSYDYQVFNYYFNSNAKLDSLFDPSLFKDEDNNQRCLSDLRMINDYKEKLVSKYTDLMKINAVSSGNALNSGTNFITKFFSKKKALKIIGSYKKKDYKPKFDELKDDLVYLNTYQETIKRDQEGLLTLNKFFKEDLIPNSNKAVQYQDIYKTTLAFHHLIIDAPDALTLSSLSKVSAMNGFELASINNDFKVFKNAYLEFIKTRNEILKEYPLSPSFFENKDYFDALKEIEDLVEDKNNTRTIAELASINQEGDILRQKGLGTLFNRLLDGNIKLNDFSDVYEQALDNAFISKYFSTDEYNNSFNPAIYEKEIKRYQDLINQYNSLAIEEVITKVTSTFANPNVNYSNANPIGQLKKLVLNGGRGITIRNALQQYESYFRTYFPCFLMSPLSAAQYLGVDSKKFDIVIFDEASQIPTSEAVGPIARGNSLVVAGDPQQMPPSNYFTMSVDDASNSEDGTNVALADAESLLDDCISIDMPRIRLAFHYRSRHESLIQFSNMNFYGGDLFTFPSFDNLTSHVIHKNIVPSADKLNSNISRNEIAAILDTLKGILDNPLTKNKSIGIVVFNMKQQDAVYDEIDKMMDKNSNYATLTHWNEEVSSKKLFIKNLENVQGDERDIIIMSIGFSKGKNGKAELGGPLMLDKGERRLNVAASRSKEEMIVLSTIRATDIDETKYKNAGAKNLKDFLAFAEKSVMPQKENSHNSSRSDLAFFIKRDLSKLGYVVDSDIGSSEMKVDLAVRKKDSDEYCLGIILDEKPLNPNVSCRDRFYVEPIVLESLKWKLLRVYTYSFLRYESETIKEITDVIEKTQKEVSINSNNSFLKPVLTSANNLIDYKIVPYQESTITFKDKLDYSQVEDGYYYSKIGAILLKIIQTEQPISYNLIKERMKKVFSITQIKSRADSVLKRHLDRIPVKATRDYNNVVFYWPDTNQDNHVDAFRSSDRDLYDISREEILVLMNKIIKAQKNISRADLIKQTAETMKIKTLTERAKKKLDDAIDVALKNNLLAFGFVENY